MSKLRNLNRQFISNLKTHEVITDAKRNLILSILKSTTTKREARNYLNKYQSQFDFSDISFPTPSISAPSLLEQRDSQRELFINRYLNKQNPFVGIYENDHDHDSYKIDKIPLRIAILKIKFSDILAQSWLGIAETFKRMVHLGISPIIILDYDHIPKDNFKNLELFIIEQANKLVQVLSKVSGDNLDLLKATVLRSLFTKQPSPSPNRAKEELSINSIEQILIPLYQGIIPIIQPIVYNTETAFQDVASSDDLLYSLTSLLLRTKELLSIEKIIMIDPVGGIPSIERNQTSHVFINLSQEYSDIVSELYIGHIEPSVRDHHLNNLRSMNKILQLCFSKAGNDDATGIITTPYIMSINNDQLNPIIYNVLTDRPVISSSLPLSRQLTPEVSTSILKKGMDVNIIDISSYPYKFTLNNLFKDSVISKHRLIALLNDSFGKELIVDEYFARIDDSLKSIIIIGDYDGAAIITWETNPHQPNAGDQVAYLDKFAIAKRNQGLPGLADVVFKQVLQTSPEELIWRSKKRNPVNKWYFERCIGCMSAPESEWKIFYTGEIFNNRIDRKLNGQPTKIPNRIDISSKLEAYLAISETIVPSFK